MVSSGALALGSARVEKQGNRETGSQPMGAGVDLLNYLKVNCVDQTRSNPVVCRPQGWGRVAGGSSY